MDSLNNFYVPANSIGQAASRTPTEADIPSGQTVQVMSPDGRRNFLGPPMPPSLSESKIMHIRGRRDRVSILSLFDKEEAAGYTLVEIVAMSYLHGNTTLNKEFPPGVQKELRKVSFTKAIQADPVLLADATGLFDDVFRVLVHTSILAAIAGSLFGCISASSMIVHQSIIELCENASFSASYLAHNNGPHATQLSRGKVDKFNMRPSDINSAKSPCLYALMEDAIVAVDDHHTVLKSYLNGIISLHVSTSPIAGLRINEMRTEAPYVLEREANIIFSVILPPTLRPPLTSVADSVQTSSAANDGPPPPYTGLPPPSVDNLLFVNYASFLYESPIVYNLTKATLGFFTPNSMALSLEKRRVPGQLLCIPFGGLAVAAGWVENELYRLHNSCALNGMRLTFSPTINRFTQNAEKVLARHAAALAWLEADGGRTAPGAFLKVQAVMARLNNEYDLPRVLRELV
ncbi:hypothetical protein BDN70DRAFT_938825 [Pholiota conissans]|uniref:Uncharacterized protein n=1 Tax=Pholiota conissans TaxID=109636 RepID=A0A9P6CRZ5_9AGAR|nr:hypothetical protein BDN70DRAFT_938825 [Pholiota conissans]